MTKAYKADVLGQNLYQEAVRNQTDLLPFQAVMCPVNGCECIYRLYDYLPAHLHENLESLAKSLEHEHPGHTSEIFLIGEQPQH